MANLTVAVPALLEGLEQHWPTVHTLQFWELLRILFPTLAAAWQGWVSFRATYLAPCIQVTLTICISLYIIHSVDKLVSVAKCLYIKLRGKKTMVLQKPGQQHESSASDKHPGSVDIYTAGRDLEAGGFERWGGSHANGANEQLLADDESRLAIADGSRGGAWRPVVMVQLPMYNERECYRQIIESSCRLEWPRDRVLVQVLDDSDDVALSAEILAETQMWQKSGANIRYLHRANRAGQKAGALKYGMSMVEAESVDFVVIFDADFIPSSDYLLRTIPFFYGRPELALVQARWSYYNSDLSVLTKYQRVSLDYHFEVEQQGMSYFTRFINFNGTAGAWRRTALEDAGGWESRTTVEDMDMAVRAHLRGWKYLFVNDVPVPSELPSTYVTYCKQQHRWAAGPAQLFKLMWRQIIFAKNFPLLKKFNLIVFFFLLRKLLPPITSFCFCILLPTTIFVPEAVAPTWISFNVPVFFSALNIALSDWSLWPYVYLFLLVENVASLTKFTATLHGFLDFQKASEWVVTGKTGATGGGLQKAAPLLKAKDRRKALPRIIHMQEFCLAVYLITAALCSVVFLDGRHSIFLFFQGLGFLLTAFELLTKLGF